MILSVKNNAVMLPVQDTEPHAFATYKVDKCIHGAEVIEEIAVGQTLGAWDERSADPALLCSLVAKIVSSHDDKSHLYATIAFPMALWHGQLSWLLTLVFGKMSFYNGISLTGLRFNSACFASGKLSGPKTDITKLRRLCGAEGERPMLMGILKPNVAMTEDSLANLYAEVAEAGVHLVKDDEIRHDADLRTTLRRIEKVAARKSKSNLKTLYAVHAPVDANACSDLKLWSSQLKNAGADALLINVWTTGLQTLQSLRQVTDLPLVAHPALAGAFGQGLPDDAICPSVSLGSLIRAAGADLTLFPSPYGKIGLPKETTRQIAHACSEPWDGGVGPTVPVPSAGIKPEHVSLACSDFGKDFILNAGTAIFAGGRSAAESVKDFLVRLENYNYAR
jgi:2,3-diketo-5-methylthiopentyl-1-phosphate enolase